MWSFMKQSCFITVLVTLVLYSTISSCSTSPTQDISTGTISTTSKAHDLVLVHGLANKHHWSEDFLNTCLDIWGSGRVFIIYTSPETTVTTRVIQGRKIIVGGGNGDSAGTESLDNQVSNMAATVKILQEKHGLTAPFSIIGHSMGGLVSRQYSYTHPDKVAALVTLGTPHHGSPLANSFQWVGFFLSATAAIEDLKPENIVHFNEQYPIANTPLTSSKTIHTIRGIPEWSDCYGWMGELFFGWQILSNIYNTQNDGLVPEDSAIIEGAKHIADFPGYDHFDLVREPSVAKTAAKYLP